MLEEILRGPLSYHTVAAPALRPFDGLDEVLRDVAMAVRKEPANSDLHAAIGNGLVRQTRYLEAIEAYRAAVAVAPDNAPARIALAELLFIAHDPAARSQLEHALQLQRVYPDPRPLDARLSVLLLLRDDAYSANAPLELIADAERIALHKYYIGNDTSIDLPRFDTVVCAFGYSRCAEPAIVACLRFIERTKARTVNDPSHLSGIARERLRETLHGVAGVSVPDIRIATAADIAPHEPLLVRPLDTQAGIGLALVRDEEDVHAHQVRWNAERYHVAPFIDYASRDGYYRKYRIILVEGIAYPYHLAISPRWMVHYRNAPMAENSWMRREEAQFLANPREVFHCWDALEDVARAIDLDYVGIDCTLLSDGSMLIFEADTAMLVHDEDDAGVFAYKRVAVAKIRNALSAMIARRADAGSFGGRTRAIR
ncbi:MAG: hypothetical protein M3N13_10905 [Candidatus Eremiobacteraeota bacterium]|nr:hypothetical protein [Candidatus Eremiobacteraeota bacterium]